MPSATTILGSVQAFEKITSHEEQLQQALKTYVDLFPVTNGYLFRYSPLGYLAEGIIVIEDHQLYSASSIRDDIRSIPGIYTAIYERQAKYYTGAEYLKQMGTKYVFTATAGLVMPITINNIVIGYIISNTFTDDQQIDTNMLASITLYGQTIGKALYQLNGRQKSNVLSRREMEVMHMIANGDTTKKMADDLDISEFTINQYVQTAMRKLGVQNRTHAVAELFRRGILT
ncbi:response regulator transcription factor [Virgibacillus xinjiangensis]|uniref:Response regulator transcription factor n=1 Tax=Virgibacillus xinjiangensis TaxID=393090 RepID=A0ABV7CSV5_9BACI